MNTMSKYSVAVSIITIGVLIVIAFFSGVVIGAKRPASSPGIHQIPSADAGAAAIIKDKNVDEKPKRKFVVLT